MGDNVQLMEKMATRGRENRDSFINSAKQQLIVTGKRL